MEKSFPFSSGIPPNSGTKSGMDTCRHYGHVSTNVCSYNIVWIDSYPTAKTRLKKKGCRRLFSQNIVRKKGQMFVCFSVSWLLKVLYRTVQHRIHLKNFNIILKKDPFQPYIQCTHYSIFSHLGEPLKVLCRTLWAMITFQVFVLSRTPSRKKCKKTFGDPWTHSICASSAHLNDIHF